MWGEELSSQRPVFRWPWVWCRRGRSTGVQLFCGYGAFVTLGDVLFGVFSVPGNVFALRGTPVPSGVPLQSSGC